MRRLTSEGRPDMRSGPEGPVQVDGGSSLDGCRQVRRGRSHDAIDGISTTLEILVGEIRYRAVALDGPGDSLGRRACVRVGVGLVEGVRRAAEGGVVHVTVAGDKGRRGEDCECLHLEYFLILDGLFKYSLPVSRRVDLSKERLTGGKERKVLRNEWQPQANRE